MPFFVSVIFNEKPKQWGLRGDPFFWEYLIKYYNAVQFPYPVDKLRQDIIASFEQLTGFLPTENKSYFVKKFAGTHVGMSTGFLSSDFWLNEAIPLLENRLSIANQSMDYKI